MIISLKFSRLPDKPLVVRTYDPEFDNIESIIWDICKFLAEDVGEWGHFIVSSLGQGCWPVRLTNDLIVVLEQLPDVLQAIAAGEKIQLDFYEQGTEMSIIFTPTGEQYTASCVNMQNYRPSSFVESVESVDRKEILRMLEAVRDEFVRVVGVVAPTLLEHPWMQAWIESCRIK
jgi:hypothetical protein